MAHAFVVNQPGMDKSSGNISHINFVLHSSPNYAQVTVQIANGAAQFLVSRVVYCRSILRLPNLLKTANNSA